jgi:hypothetical protein
VNLHEQAMDAATTTDSSRRPQYNSRQRNNMVLGTCMSIATLLPSQSLQRSCHLTSSATLRLQAVHGICTAYVQEHLCPAQYVCHCLCHALSKTWLPCGLHGSAVPNTVTVTVTVTVKPNIQMCRCTWRMRKVISNAQSDTLHGLHSQQALTVTGSSSPHRAGCRTSVACKTANHSAAICNISGDASILTVQAVPRYLMPEADTGSFLLP